MNCRSYGDSGSKGCRLASDVIHEVAEQEGSVCDDQDVLPCLFSAGRSVAVCRRFRGDDGRDSNRELA